MNLSSDIIKYSIEMIEQLTLFQFTSNNGSILNDSRLSNYFIKALHSIGSTNKCNYLSLVSNWCEEKSANTQTIDPFLLEGLIILGNEEFFYVKEKLDELQCFRFEKGRIELPTSHILQGDLFSTMFTLRIVLNLKDKSKFDEEKIEKSIEWVLSKRHEINTIKDKAIPIFLISISNIPKFKNYDVELYKELKNDLNDFKSLLLTTIKQNDERETLSILESALWIIYDLIPLKGKTACINKYLSELMNYVVTCLAKYISKIIYNNDMSDKQIYFKTRIYSLYIIVFSQYFGSHYSKMINDELLHINITKKIELYPVKQEDTLQPYIHAIKNWIKIDCKNVKQLSGGFSGSEIVRISPTLTIPFNNQKYDISSIICKISDTDNFEKELDNYNKIPPYLKDNFSKLSELVPIRQMDSSKIFLIMEDLTDYKTLKELINQYENNKLLNLESHLLFLCKKLSFIYLNTLGEVKVDLSKLYLEDIIKSISVIFKSNIHNKENIIEQLLSFVTKINNDLKIINLRFSNLIHGDLNLRNIMILDNSNDIRFKFIDFDNLQLKGDYIYDIGELIVDIDANYGNLNLSSIIENNFRKFAEKNNDLYFEKRLVISKFRCWLKLAKIYLNRGSISEGSAYINLGLKLLSEQYMDIDYKDKNTKFTIESYNEVAEGYCKHYFGKNVMKKDLEYFISSLAKKGHILDLGCGPGQDSLFFAKNNYPITGIDLSAEMIKISSENVPQGEFHIMDMRSDLLDLKKNFSGVWACSSLLHLDKLHLKNVLLNIYKILETDGILYFSMMKGKGSRLKTEKRPFGEVTRYFSFYNDVELINLISEVDFKILKKYDKGRWLSYFCKK